MSTAMELVWSAAWLPALAQFAAKATLVLLLSAAVAALLWRASAAVRHLVWCVGVAGVLALPPLAVLLPAWELPLPSVAAAAPPAVAVELRRPELLAPPSASPPEPVWPSAAPPAAEAAAVLERTPSGAAIAHWLPRATATLLLAGMLAGMLWLAVGFWGVARLGRGAELVRELDWLRLAQETGERLELRRPVLLLRSRGAAMPATWGLLWPSVVLPATADGWSDDRRRAVLAHELAHVRRFDCLTQALAQLACVLLWWHPGMWYAARRLRVERERACDDLVLRTGARASDYATHLLEIARAYRAPRLGAPALVSMARPSQLESRLLSVLDAARSRAAPSTRATLAAVLLGLAVIAPLSTLQPATLKAAQQPPAGEPRPHAPRESAASVDPHVDVDVDVEVDADPEVDVDVDLDAGRRVPGMRFGAPGGAVDTSYIEAMRAAGYPDFTLDELIELKMTGVTPRYVAEIRSVGLRPTADELVELRTAGVTAEYVRELGRHGLTGLSADQLQELGLGGVTGEYVTQMRALGLGELDADALAELGLVDVTPDYVRALSRAGLGGLSAEALTELRVFGVTAELVRELDAAGVGPLTPDQLVRLRASGLDRELIRSRGRPPAPDRPKP